MVLTEMDFYRMEALHQELMEVTKGCRPDMHEPDEQGVSATVTGRKLDNAGLSHELAVHINNEVTGESRMFLLADLIALARTASFPEFDDYSE